MNTFQLESRLSHFPHSPLFARLAHAYLTAGRVADAKLICTAGLDLFPTYISATIILAKCLAAEGQFLSAVELLDRAISVQPASPVLIQLRSEWIKSIRSDEKFNRSDMIDAGSTNQSVADEVVVTSELESTADSQKPPESLSDDLPTPTDHSDALIDGATNGFGVEARLQSETPTSEPSEVDYETPVILQKDVAAENATLHSEVPENKEVYQIIVPGSDAEPPPAEPFVPSPVEFRSIESNWGEDGRIVSKTLAEIFASQGEFAEAIITYQLLRKQRPALASEIDQRIKELHIKLQVKLTPQQ